MPITSVPFTPYTSVIQPASKHYQAQNNEQPKKSDKMRDEKI